MKGYKFAESAFSGTRFTVYALVDPRTAVIRYVGKSAGPLERRIRAHFWATSLVKKCRKNYWIRQLQGLGLSVVVEVLEVCVDEFALNVAEAFHIANIRAAGGMLLNMTDGGDGATGYRYTREQRARARMVHKTRVRTPWSTAARIAISRGKGGRTVVDAMGVRFETLHEAARALGLRVQDVSDIVRGRVHQVRGIRLRYADEGFPKVRIRERAVVDESGVRYRTVSDAARALGVSISAVSLVANGKRRSVRGHVFRFVDSGLHVPQAFGGSNCATNGSE